MVAGHLQIKKGKYYMVLELKSESGERKTKWISTGLSAKGNKRKAEAMRRKRVQITKAQTHQTVQIYFLRTICFLGSKL